MFSQYCGGNFPSPNLQLDATALPKSFQKCVVLEYQSQGEHVGGMSRPFRTFSEVVHNDRPTAHARRIMAAIRSLLGLLGGV
jgi:hypothetical protein